MPDCLTYETKKHPVKCACCGSKKMLAVFTTVRHRRVEVDGTLGEYTDRGTTELDYYECENCGGTVDAL